MSSDFLGLSSELVSLFYVLPVVGLSSALCVCRRKAQVQNCSKRSLQHGILEVFLLFRVEGVFCCMGIGHWVSWSWVLCIEYGVSCSGL